MKIMATIKNILIIGATGGIGASVARSLADKNTNLILHGSSEQKLNVLKMELVPLCNKIKTYVSDLSHGESTQSLANSITDLYKEFDWVINAAGYIDEKEAGHSPSYSNLVRAFQVNTIAPIHITQMLQDKLSDHGGVIMISSTASILGNPRFPIYSASKSALNTFTQALAKQFEGSRKKAVVICPGGTNTPMRERIAQDAITQQSPEVIAKQIKEIIEHSLNFSNGDIVVIRDNKISKHTV